MELIRWSPAFQVGIKIIDTQHQHLVELINELNENFQNHSENRAVLEKIISDLATYTKVHFTTEEKLMASHIYPDHFKHKSQHSDFIEKIRKFHKDFTNGKANLSQEMISFLNNWLINHIIDSDKRLAIHIANDTL